MEVIQKGKQLPIHSFEAQCRRCGSILKVKATDVHPFDQDFRDGSFISYFQCPECAAVHTFYKTPSFIYETLYGDNLE